MKYFQVGNAMLCGLRYVLKRVDANSYSKI